MALIIELTPQQQARLAEAARHEGLQPEELAARIVTAHLPEVTPEPIEQDPTLALFTQWAKEDANMTPEEIEQEHRLWEAFEKDINAIRRVLDMR